MDLGDIKEVSEVSQNAQKCPRRLRMASTCKEREKLKVPKNSLKPHDYGLQNSKFPNMSNVSNGSSNGVTNQRL
jgi:hypothetical protein